jgi:hypothetical protein
MHTKEIATSARTLREEIKRKVPKKSAKNAKEIIPNTQTPQKYNNAYNPLNKNQKIFFPPFCTSRLVIANSKFLT